MMPACGETNLKSSRGILLVQAKQLSNPRTASRNRGPTIPGLRMMGEDLMFARKNFRQSRARWTNYTSSEAALLATSQMRGVTFSWCLAWKASDWSLYFLKADL